MKKKYSFCFLIGNILYGKSLLATLSYGLTVTVPGYTALGGGTAITNFNSMFGCGDGAFSSVFPIGFTFVYDAHNYTQFQVTENGRLFLGSTVSPCNDNCGAGCDGFGPSFQVQPSSGVGGGLAASVIHPTICPLWDDLAFNVAGANASYLTTGTAGNRVLTVEWLLMDWKFNNVNSPHTGTISFQVKLYEAPVSQIDFFYKQEPQPLGATPAQHAKIGLTGFTAGDFYSTNELGSTPSKVSETDVAAKPADGARFRWNVVIPLPIDLVSFSGKNLGKENLLRWETSVELNNDYFTIDRSADAVNFEAIGTIDGAGNSSTLLRYSYTDGPLPGSDTTFYYRLKQTDFDGHFTQSGIIALKVPEGEEEPPDLYYDAASGQLNVAANFLKSGNFILDIVDPLGRSIYHENLFIPSKGRVSFPVLLTSLSAGIYNARITGSDGTVQSKFIHY